MSDQDKIDVIIANLHGIGKDRMATDLQNMYDGWLKENMELTKRLEVAEKKPEIPEWIIKYDKNNYSSGAGKAIRELLKLLNIDSSKL